MNDDLTPPPQNLLTPDMNLIIPGSVMPSFRVQIALQNGVEKNLLMVTWGGMGDQICAEPTLRWALNKFTGHDISLASEIPSLFQHLKFKNVYDLKKVRPIYENYLVFQTIYPAGHTHWDFLNHMVTNCVDYPSLCCFRCQLPVADREVRLVPTEAEFVPSRGLESIPAVAIHAGRHWQSKTFPADWWNGVIRGILEGGAKPVLIGADTDDNRGTVDVNTEGCIDLRGKLTVMESVALLQSVRVLLTNDSAPLHMAASGEAHIGYVATCKHPDYLTHWRKGQWGWRMRNFGLGGIWDHLDYCPNKAEKIDVDEVGDALLRSWLPEPDEMAKWAVECLDHP